MYKNPHYDLKYQYRRVLELSAVTSILLMIGLFVQFKQFDHHVQVKAIEVPLLEVQDIPWTKHVRQVPIPVKPTIPIEDSDIDIAEELPFLDQTALEEYEIGAIPPPPMFEEAVPIYMVEVEPQIIGGNTAIANYIMEHDLFPRMAREAGVTGKVLIEFVVDKNGYTRDIQVAQERPLDLGFGEAGIKVMQAMRFTPGIQNDRAVAVKMAQSIRFNIQ